MSKAFFLAPMAELSHRALRELIFSFGGVDEYFTEMINAPTLVSGGALEEYYIDAEPCPEKVVFQLIGADEERLAAAAAMLDKRDCKGIDINMGCSAPAITHYGAGSAWMIHPEKAWKMAALVRKSVTKRLSVKLRLGQEEDFESLLTFCKGLVNEGVELITLHPRTTKQKLKRRAMWNYVADLKKELSIPVAGNGDVSSLSELLSRAEGPWDAVMVGRAAIKSPWIFAAAKAAAGDQSLPVMNSINGFTRVNLEEIAFRYLDLLEKYQPVEFHKSRAHRFFQYYCGNFVWGNYLFTLIGREKDLSAIRKILKDYFNDHSEEREHTL
ncbi:MAG: tRNA-dihydrouridine synthase family protein [Treponema sp.]|jgi:tRNA-dihydrouridine synthase|nr:tRNA-dihydrouridine synthase family protein [Treponema sp.]